MNALIAVPDLTGPIPRLQIQNFQKPRDWRG